VKVKKVCDILTRIGKEELRRKRSKRRETIERKEKGEAELKSVKKELTKKMIIL
jgi:hypothetical protein